MRYNSLNLQVAMCNFFKLLFISLCLLITNSSFSQTITPVFEWVKVDTTNCYYGINSTISAASDFKAHNNYIYNLSENIQKLDTNGNIIWSRPYTGFKIEIDNDDNVLIFGAFYDSTYNKGSVSLVNNSGSDRYLIKLDSAGNLIWVQQFSNATACCNSYSDLCIDYENNIYILGNNDIQKINANSTISWSLPVVCSDPDVYLAFPYRNMDIAYSSFDSTIVFSSLYNGAGTIGGNDVYLTKIKTNKTVVFNINSSNSNYYDEGISIFINQANGNIFNTYNTYTIGCSGSTYYMPYFSNIKVYNSNGDSINSFLISNTNPLLSLSGNNDSLLFVTNLYSSKFTTVNQYTGNQIYYNSIVPFEKVQCLNHSIYLKYYYLNTINNSSNNYIHSYIGKKGDSSSPFFITMPQLAKICNGQSYTPYCNINGGASPFTYSWSPITNISNSSILNPIFSPTTTTTYTLQATDSLGNLAIDSFTITVDSLPIVYASVSTNVICAGDSINIGKIVNGFYQFVGKFFPQTTHTYTLSATNIAGCTSYVPVTIFVNPLPTISIAKIPSNGYFCTGDSVLLNASGANNYVWDNGITNNVYFHPNGTQVYNLIATDANGCVKTTSTSFTLGDYPSIKITPIIDTYICQNESINLSATNANNFNTFKWYLNNILKGQNNHLIANDSGNYILNSTNLNGCYSSDTIQINKFNNPTPAIINNGNSLTFNAVNNWNFNWYFNSSNIGTLPNLTPTQTGYYILTAQDSLGCIGKDSFYYAKPSGIQDINSNKLIIYPNPASNKIFIENIETHTVQLFNNIGQLIDEKNVENKKVMFTTTNLVKGIYFIKSGEEIYKIIME